MDISFCSKSFSRPSLTAHYEGLLGSLLWALVLADVGDLLAAPRTPLLHQSGVEYRAEVPRPGRTGCDDGDGQERFLSAPYVQSQGHADCEDLAAWRCAELRIGRDTRYRGPAPKAGHPPVSVCPPPPLPVVMRGQHPVAQWYLKPIIDAWPAFYRRQQPNGVVLYHIIVNWPDGRLEDPSRALGMV